jgi:predicted phage tail protein|nr:MAG TPA: tail protein [Caudoviricetes sp.]
MGGGGGKAKTPTLINDNLFHKQFYRVLDILSEGPIYGPVNTAAPLNCVMLNDTPVTDAVGNTSIPGVSVAWRPGTADQSPINGFNAIESTVMVNAQVKYDTPLVRTVSDPNVTRVRLNIGVDSLVESDSESNQHETSVFMAIDVKPSSSSIWSAIKAVQIGPGKISGEYLESHIIDAPDEKPFDIRVRRITPDSTGDLLQNDTRWNSYSEIIDDNLSYPHTAVAGAVIDHDQYTDTPTRTYHMRGLIVDVPDNYDPETRTYSGLWLGGMKQVYTNNPAWIFRYLVKNERFGLARHAGYIDVDDGALYTLSQYCDQLVDDGYGGLEPRVTLNAYITEQMSARDLLDNIAGMFRGIALWDGQTLTVMLDAPQDPIATITNANVVDGAFTRSSIARAECYNAVIVSWTDPENGWEQSKEYVADDELIARDGYNETTLEAFGCTSRGQAYRAGKWLIETAKREPSKFTFKMARDAIHFTPGDIIEILDNNRAGARLGGRIVANNGNVITVDKVDSEYITAGDTISLLDSDGKFKKHQITGVNGNEITLAAAPAWIRNGTVFAVSTEAAKPVLCRITSVAETENNSVYTIEAAQHDPNKQAVVDEGAIFEVNSDTLNHFRVPNIENLKVINIGSETVQCRATWETQTTTRALTFEIRIYDTDGRVVASYETQNYRYDFFGLECGNYSLGIRGRNDTGMKGAETLVDLIVGAPAAPTGVNWVPGVFQATVYPISNSTLTTDTTYEFYYAGENQITDFSLVTTSAQFSGRGYQWTFGGMATGHTYYVYVRTKNAFGVSDFIEASGKPSENFEEITDAVLNEVMEGEQFQDMIKETIDEVTGGLMGDVEELKQTTVDIDQAVTDLKESTADLEERVKNNEDGIGEHESQINEISVELTEQENELIQTRASLQNAAIALMNNSLANTSTRTTLTAQYKNQKAETKAEIERIDTVIATEKEATAQALTTLESKVNDEISANVTELQQTIATLESSTSQSIEKLESQVNEDIQASITEINQTITDLESSTSESISNLEAKVDGDISSAISNMEQALATHEKANATQFNSLQSQIDENEAAITETNQTIATNEQATAQKLEQLQAQIDDDVAAAITEMQSALATHEQANATQFAEISASLEANEASITEWSEAFTTYKESTATQIESITASIEGQSVSIEENKTAIAGLETDMSATWSVKIAADNNGMKYFSGISLGLTGSGTSTQSQCIFLADRFVLMTAANGTYTTPFYVTNGAMYVREAFIKDASITNAKIGSYIQSNNYVSGSTGWKLDKSGTFENYGSVSGEGAMKWTNTTISVRDGNSVLRVQIGRITGSW